MSESTSSNSNLSALISKLEKVEFKTDRDLYEYARILRAIGLELNMRVAMDADVVSAILGQYKGKWYTFGLHSKARGKLVGAHLRVGAQAAKTLGLSGVKMYASFVKHFVQPEVEAEKKAREGKGAKKPGFSIGDKAAEKGPGRPGEAGGKAA